MAIDCRTWQSGKPPTIGIDGAQCGNSEQMNAFDDPRVATGMTAQFAQRRARIQAGERPIGWKLGFGTTAALAKFALPGPLVGYMMEASILPSGGLAELGGWVKPVAEPEIAVRIAQHSPGGGGVAIDGYAAAIELADLHFAPEDVDAILAANIYHRHVILGEFVPVATGFAWSSLLGSVERSGVPVASVDDVSANTGAIPAILDHCARTLAAGGERMRPGDVVILGSVVPPIFLTPEDTGVAFAVSDAGEARIGVSWRR